MATRARLALDGDGLLLVDSASGSTRVIAFGAPETEAITAVASAVGAPRGRSTNLECGAGPLDFVAFERGLLVNVQKARFVGWTVRPERQRPLRTMSGIGLVGWNELRRALTASHVGGRLEIVQHDCRIALQALQPGALHR